MATQQVFRLPQRSSVNDLCVGTEPVPEPPSYEVLIRIRSVALNYRDFAVATGKYPFPVKDYVVPCSDVAGDVVKVGSQMTDLTKTTALAAASTAVCGSTSPLPAPALVNISSDVSLSYSQLNALYGNVPLKPGQIVLFLGTGGVSIMGLILAKAAGATTIITSSSDSKLKHVRVTYGADFTINYKSTTKWSEEVLKVTKGHGADYIFENGGAGTIAESINAVAYRGSIAVIGFLASCPQDQMPDVAALALSKGAVVRGIMVGSKHHLDEVCINVS
ncbi:alcohol dehydrogenase [Colletotrichum incanum]|nr:alcohol dehydrogenase [Colletotrichum incanum]